MDTIRIEQATSISDELAAGVVRLARELEPAAPVVTRARLEEIVRSDACRLLVAFVAEDEAPCGMLLLARYPTPTAERFWIEDVAVLADARGRGVGEALLRRALGIARAEGAGSVDLTCRPSREAANRLYARVGFVRRQTNVYRFEL